MASPTLLRARTPAQYAAARTLLEEYARELGVDLCFQEFAAELAGLPAMYGPPAGSLLLARRADDYAGCIGVRPLTARRCELKRLYVRAAARGAGLGRALAEAAIAAARAAGYECMLLDTLPGMVAARRLYRSLGFRQTAAYYESPIAGAIYLKLDLRRPD